MRQGCKTGGSTESRVPGRPHRAGRAPILLQPTNDPAETVEDTALPEVSGRQASTPASHVHCQQAGGTWAPAVLAQPAAPRGPSPGRPLCPAPTVFQENATLNPTGSGYFTVTPSEQGQGE